MRRNSYELKTESDEKNETSTSTPIQFIDCWELYNRLQLTPCTITIDLQPKDVYDKSHIKNALNIDKSSSDYDPSKLYDIINQFQIEQCKKTINSIYFYSNRSAGYFKTIQSIKDILLEKEVLSKEDTLCILKENYKEFVAKFPFLCESTAEANAKEKKNLKIPRWFMAANKGVYPNQIINDRIYLGDKNGALNEKVLKDLKITHIINCTPKPPDYVETFTSKGYIKNYFEDNKEMNIKYLRVDIDDSILQDISKHFNEAIEFISKAYMNENNRIYIHCFAGISRSTTITIAYLMKTRGMSFENAFKFIKEKREVVQPNKGFVEQLKRYEKELEREQMVITEEDPGTEYI